MAGGPSGATTALTALINAPSKSPLTNAVRVLAMRIGSSATRAPTAKAASISPVPTYSTSAARLVTSSRTTGTTSLATNSRESDTVTATSEIAGTRALRSCGSVIAGKPGTGAPAKER